MKTQGTQGCRFTKKKMASGSRTILKKRHVSMIFALFLVRSKKKLRIGCLSRITWRNKRPFRFLISRSQFCCHDFDQSQLKRNLVWFITLAFVSDFTRDQAADQWGTKIFPLFTGSKNDIFRICPPFRF